MANHGWRTYVGHRANNCLILLLAVYNHRNDPLYFTGQTQKRLAEWSGIPQQRISDILREAQNGRIPRDASYMAKFGDKEERTIWDIVYNLGSTTDSVLSITARKYGFRYVLNPRPGCIIDVYSHETIDCRIDELGVIEMDEDCL